MRRILAIFFATAIVAVTGSSMAQQVTFIDILGSHRGVLGEPDRLHSVLAGLGALPATNEPTVVYIQSVDSRYTVQNEDYSSDTSKFRDRIELMAAVANEVGGPEPIFVATQWDTPNGRESYAATLAAPTPVFPTTTDELAATGYEWLVDPAGFKLVWDLEGVIPDFAASRQTARGVEYISPVEIIVCVDQEGITGWARGRRDNEATPAAIGRFTRQCLSGELTLPEVLVLPPEFLEQHGLTGLHFAVVMPYAYSDVVPVDAAVARAESVLAQASVQVPMLVVATSTLSVDATEYVPSEQHARDLAVLGIDTDPQVNALLPDWVQGFMRHTGTTLVLFDDSGAPVAAFVASPSNPATQSTLSQALVRYGLF